MQSFHTGLAEQGQQQMGKSDDVIKKMQVITNILSHLKTDMKQQLEQVHLAVTNNTNASDPAYIAEMARTIAERNIQERMAEHEQRYQSLQNKLKEMHEKLKEEEKKGIIQKFLPKK